MPRTVVKMPRVADTVDEVLVLEWLVADDASVTVGDPIIRVETDKVEVEVPSPVTGTVIEKMVNVGDEVETGSPICAIES